ncbi:MAG: alpha/beta fold hydrolase, partial [Myxococcales bacterium]|nr:alpha/beta fold hydrolase [Myxococcales bacterium]
AEAHAEAHPRDDPTVSAERLATRAHRLSVDGYTVGIDQYDGPGEPVGVAIVGHAMMADRRSVERPRGAGLCSTLAGAGFRVYAFDCRGRGDERDRVAQGASWGYDEIVERDIPQVVEWVRQREPSRPLAFVGHSLTAHAGLYWAAGLGSDAPIRAFVAFACNLWNVHDEPSALHWAAKRALLEAWGAVARGVGYFPARRLGIGSSDEPLSYVLDLLRFARTGRIRARSGMDYTASLQRLSVPVLAFCGTADRLYCRCESARRFLAPIADAVLLEIPEVDHMGVIGDRRARHAWRFTAEWLRERMSI